MRYATLFSRAVMGMDAPEIQIEVHATNGLPSLAIVGLPEASVKESKDRVRSALISCGFQLPPKRITINLAPADLPKAGSRYDLAIALGILVATGQLTPRKNLEQFEWLGELGLNGEVRAIKGVVPSALQTLAAHRILICPEDNLVEASILFSDSSEIAHQVLGANHLLAICQYLQEDTAKLTLPLPLHNPTSLNFTEDLSDIRGQAQAKRVLEVCASGQHSLLMIGPPGSGKSMLASRLLTLMPALNHQQAIEVAAIHSLAGMNLDSAKLYQRKLINPHHTSTTAAMVGGGSHHIKPGAISLAHESVLFLDELPEFQRPVLEALREPLETHKVEIARVNLQVSFPAKALLVAAMNPSPSGFFPDDPLGRCKDTPEQIQRYFSKISGPLLDRIDCHLEIPPLNFADLKGVADANAETSSQVRERVTACQRIQLTRQGCLNSALAPQQLQRFAKLDAASESFMEQAMNRLGLSARAYHRILRLARTLADMKASHHIELPHIAEAVGYRFFDKMRQI